MKRKVAIFDIDGTVFRSSLLIELINQLVADGVFSKSAQKAMEKDYVAWLDRVGTYEDYLESVIKIFYKHVKGKKKKQIDAAVRRVIHGHKNRVYRFTRDLIKALKKKEYFLLTVSGSPMDIVEPFAKYLGFNAYQGRIFEIKNGLYTGKVLNNEQMNKRKDKIAEQYLKEAGIEIDKQKSVAIGDTETDIPMLAMFRNAIAFNPNNNLARVAKTKKWDIIVERKDVIFEIQKFNFLNK